MTFLSRLTKLGLAKEVTPGTWLTPTISVPFNTAKFVDVITPLRDESVRANDDVLQGLVRIDIGEHPLDLDRLARLDLEHGPGVLAVLGRRLVDECRDLLARRDDVQVDLGVFDPSRRRVCGVGSRGD